MWHRIEQLPAQVSGARHWLGCGSCQLRQGQLPAAPCQTPAGPQEEYEPCTLMLCVQVAQTLSGCVAPFSFTPLCCRWRARCKANTSSPPEPLTQVPSTAFPPATPDTQVVAQHTLWLFAKGSDAGVHRANARSQKQVDAAAALRVAPLGLLQAAAEASPAIEGAASTGCRKAGTRAPGPVATAGWLAGGLATSLSRCWTTC